LALKILLVDKNEDWLIAAKEYFDGLLYETKMVNNGKDAQVALYNEKFFAVVMNVKVQNHPGIQVLKFIRANHPTQKVLMVTELEEGLDEEEQMTPEKLKKLGATEAICKPFEFADLKGLLEGHQSVGDMVSSIPKRKELGPEEEVDMGDDKFTSVKIDEFYTSQPVLFDLYIKLKSNRYIKILHAGDSFSKERLDKYKNEKNVEYLYFEKKDLFKYVKFNNYFAKKIIENKKIGGQKKVKLLQNVASKFLEQTFQEGMKPQIIDQGKEIAENVYELIKESKDLHEVFRNYQDFDPNAFTHAYLVTLFSTSIIKQFEWQSKTTIECTALACMFHDIGKMKLDPALLDLKVDEMNDEQLLEYKRHPELGLELIDGNPLINNSVKQIILQHHEHFDGTGFPFNKRGSKILTLSNIVCLADNFVHIIQDEDQKPVEALRTLLSRREELTWYNSMIVECLIKVFTDPGKIMKEHQLPSNSRVVNKKVS
jgi:response regulator RpfG family c-di-GMP phosphodiesterase